MKKGHRHWPEVLRELDPNGALASTDAKIVRINRDLKIIKYINPVHSTSERETFFQSRYRHVPQFKYLPLAFDSAQMRRDLANLPVGSSSMLYVALSVSTRTTTTSPARAIISVRSIARFRSASIS